MEKLNILSNFLDKFIDANNQIIIFESEKIIECIKKETPQNLKLNKKDYESFRKKVAKKKGICFYHSNQENYLEYFSTGIWRNDECIGLIVVGPFVTSKIDEFKLQKISIRSGSSTEERENLKEFYKKLIHSEINSFNMLGELLINIDFDNYTLPTFVADIEEDTEINLEREIDLKENEDIIELRYSYEEEFISAITNGDEHRAIKSYLTHKNYFDFSNRVPGKNLRMLKNGLIIMNTLSRKGAQRGGLHPKYLHSISDKFAVEIENSNNLYFLKILGKSIISEYSRAVRMYSIKGYSKPVAKAMDYIYSNLSKRIGLSEVANKTFINASHLSRKFKEETGHTITNYINLKKIERAKLLLQENKSINEVTFMLEFSEESYFNKVFKRYAGITPAKYLKSIN